MYIFKNKSLYLFIASFVGIFLFAFNVFAIVNTNIGNGAWCWFADPRAVRYQGTYDRTYIGWVDENGNIGITSYDYDTQAYSKFILHYTLQADDHDNPAIFIRDDGRLQVFYSKHSSTGNAMYYRISTKPEDITSWGAEATIGVNSSGSYGYTYPNPIQLSREDNLMYLFWRGGDFQPTFSTSTDGTSWSPVKNLFQVPNPGGTSAPYVKYASDNRSRINFAISNNYPSNSATSSIYFAYYDDGSFYKADGTFIKTINQLPLLASEMDQVYDGVANGAGSLVWDIAFDDLGSPVIVYANFPGASPSRADDHRYRYAYFDGTNWRDYEITPAGGDVDEVQANGGSATFYSGGISLNHSDPSIVYLSKEVDGQYEIQKWATSDHGLNWVSENITSGSSQKNMRPILPRGSVSDSDLIWMNGIYDYYGENDMFYYTDLMLNSYATTTPLIIDSIQDLYNIRNNLTSDYILDVNLDFNDLNSYDITIPNGYASVGEFKSAMTTGSGWLPIYDAPNSFMGTFNGNGHKISNLYINRPTEAKDGLFASIGTSGLVEKLALENVNITGTNTVGGIAGINSKGKIKDSYVTGSVIGTLDSGRLSIGGLVGPNEGVDSYTGIIENSYVNALIDGPENTGGLFGSNTGNIINSYYDYNTTGQSSGNEEARATLEMTYPYDDSERRTYTGWDFDTIWYHDINGDINDGYPFNYLIQHTLSYSAGTGGTISGDTNQVVAHSRDGQEVTAVPSSGYVFDSWSDDVLTASRTDFAVVENKTVTANFVSSDSASPTSAISINNGNTHTTSSSVTLTFIASDNTSATSSMTMNISNYSSFATSTGWISFSNSTSTWTILGTSGINTVYFLVKDEAGNISATSSDSIIFDNTSPTIIITGSNPASVYIGDSYSDAGATATDTVDGTVTTTVISNDLNTSTIGTYTITYSATDTAGNISTSTRTINVISRPGGGGGGSPWPIVNPNINIDRSPTTTTPIDLNNDDNKSTGSASTTLIKLFKYNNDPKVYLLENGKKRWIKDEYTFNALGYKWNDVQVLDNSNIYQSDLDLSLFQFTKQLKPRSTGNDVIQLQTLLKKLGFFTYKEITNFFGQQTYNALIKFQKANKLKQTGVVDNTTRIKLNEILKKGVNN